MSELKKGCTAQENEPAAAAAALLLANYSFDVGGYRASELVARWIGHYPANWVRLAVIEALYQGRYKAVSVEQILVIWLRRNQPLYHFKYEFERLVCSKLPKELQEQFFTSSADSLEESRQHHINAVDRPAAEISFISGDRSAAPTLNPFEALAQPVLEEHIASSIAVAADRESHPSPNETCVEVPSGLLPKSDEPKSPLTNGYSGYQSRQQLPSLEFSDFSSWNLGYRPIDRFIPDSPSSDFYTKLKAFAYPIEEV
ncbi:hypothetical protein [Argonema antarcticum]|uniref:hypothetical protein n=1 Tax=Argonema antarcticum TaxID=2942763 RepID=UPI0020137E71|nr:hypothetical protein [Argonema antarcticum]MCL1469451.1 hypothetical protein [Argonema antarcticum A004/B2]